jgi:hypothetical protein
MRHKCGYKQKKAGRKVSVTRTTTKGVFWTVADFPRDHSVRMNEMWLYVSACVKSVLCSQTTDWIYAYIHFLWGGLQYGLYSKTTGPRASHVSQWLSISYWARYWVHDLADIFSRLPLKNCVKFLPGSWKLAQGLVSNKKAWPECNQFLTGTQIRKVQIFDPRWHEIDMCVT